SVYKTSKAKENILKRVREALLQDAVAKPFPEIEAGPAPNVYAASNQDSLEEAFAFEFSKSGGQFIFCNDNIDFAEQLSRLAAAKVWKEVACASHDLFIFLVGQGLNFVREINFRIEVTNAC